MEIAARIHQSHIPGSDIVSQPTVCIITPYSAQVDEIKTCLQSMSSKELFHDLIEVRTQTAATGGEWDNTITFYTRINGKGILSEANRLNFMLTRAKYVAMDIFDETMYSSKSHGMKAIKRYAGMQRRNGAQCKDLRNWGNACRRCCEPHYRDCRKGLKCFFCENESHHARRCTEPGSLDPTINPDVMNFPALPADDDADDDVDKEEDAVEEEEIDPMAQPMFRLKPIIEA